MVPPTNYSMLLPAAFTLRGAVDINRQNQFNSSQSIGVARIFDWGRPKSQITCNDVIRNFQKRNFLEGKDIAEWKIWSRGLLSLNEDFDKERESEN